MSPSAPTKMTYRLLGNSGLLVSKISLGAWMTWDERCSDSAWYDIMTHAFKSGVNYFDNAEGYIQGKSEEIVGRAIQKGIQEGVWSRESLVISTKIHTGTKTGPNDQGLSRKHIVEGLEASLKRLQLGYVDVVFCHRPDDFTPIEETVRAMNHVIERGWAFYWGTSQWMPADIEEACQIADRLGLIRPVVEQPKYNIFDRPRVEYGFLDLFKRYKLGLTTYSPLAYGVLSGKYTKSTPDGSRFTMELYNKMVPDFRDRVVKAVELQKIADELGCSLAQMSIAWCVSNPNASTVMLGARTMNQLDENLQAIRFVDKITPEIKARINAAVDYKIQIPEKEALASKACSKRTHFSFVLNSMKVYGVFMMAAAMASVVAAGSGTICDMDPMPAVTPAATEAPVTEATEAPVTQAGDGVTQDDVGGEADVAASGDATQDTTQASGDATQDTTQTISGGVQQSAGTVSSTYSYTGSNCGGSGFSYDQVTDIATCSKTPVTTNNPVSPFDVDVSLAFRGPATIYNIGVFTNVNGTWNKVSSYKNGGEATNMVFLNNNNIDYGGQGSPEGFAKADGTGVATESTPFSGTLASATDPAGQSILAEDKTGAEVHIMTEQKCGVDAECPGAYDNDGTAFLGWDGPKKIFVFTVSMEHGGAPDVPAVWMLSGQSMRSGQYQCNCRGVGPAGGCGELDIVEVLEKDTSFVATHYYFYDGTYNPGNDQFAQRPTEGPATYVTIIDEAYGVKVLQIDNESFDYGCGSISDDVVSQWESAE
ncbi:hypothetical protein JM18_002061 [Phytophthora kernoviae]|uniref:NADP-dependent oxidoreductase domain-containing protein n=1 Tax=Phytophthora kernoviae TaxID=325452 RepID=A0A922AR91_9STRA|nr:hypothetical protein JM18_002061 [Phytophthora kernoviae]